MLASATEMVTSGYWATQLPMAWSAWSMSCCTVHPANVPLAMIMFLSSAPLGQKAASISSMRTEIFSATKWPMSVLLTAVALGFTVVPEGSSATLPWLGRLSIKACAVVKRTRRPVQPTWR